MVFFLFKSQDFEIYDNLYGSFSGCSSLKSLPGLSKWKPKNLLYISHLFDSCSSLTYIPDISKWNIII